MVALNRQDVMRMERSALLLNVNEESDLTGARAAAGAVQSGCQQPVRTLYRLELESGEVCLPQRLFRAGEQQERNLERHRPASRGAVIQIERARALSRYGTKEGATIGERRVFLGTRSFDRVHLWW